ncbi:hypothetical protein ACKWTF_006731 [Chironomus riparius]
MAFLMDYWDTLDIGRPELNHSQGFFRRTHSLHEKGIEFEDKKLKVHQKSSLANAAATAKTDVPKQNKASNKENVPINKPAQQQTNRAILAVSIVKKSNLQSQAPSNIATKPNVSKPSAKLPAKQSKAPLKKSTSVSSSSTNIAKKEETKKVLTKSVSHQKLNTKIDKLYEQAEIQKKRKEVLTKKIKAEEEKELKFKFQAKPVPKFVKTAPSLQAIITKQQIAKQNSHEEKKKLVKQQSMPNISTIHKKSCPQAGNRIVPSCGNPERIKAMQEHKKQLIEKYKPENVNFKAKPAAVLQKPIFQPKHNFKALDAKPFKLVLTQRMMQRSTFDRQLQEALVIKEKQQEILQRQHDLEERKIIRQKTEFRARPNPFGRY